jgi:colanic acid/amylovoran biosynthesis glycosyltransferase
LFYFAPRLPATMVMSADALEARLQGLPGRRVRMMFSGRYERMKGAVDAVQAAAACLARGLDVEMDTYGQGSQAEAMRAVAAGSGGRIRVHDAIPFPELVKKTHAADLFICCHIQSDPSCTYLESMGAGLPIVGYANRMWTSMAEQSHAGVVTPVNTPDAVADAVQQILATPGALEDASRRAQRFATEHAFEIEFRRRTDAINAALET